METDVSQDFQDYWNEYKVVTQDQKSDDDCVDQPKSLDYEGINEVEWLVLAGLPHFTDTFFNGQIIDDAELEPVINLLSVHQADAVKKRVNSLNQTIKHRTKIKNKKPDIRDVFKNVQNVENTTDGYCHKNLVPDNSEPDANVPTFFSLTENYDKLQNSYNESKASFKSPYVFLVPQHEMFRRTVRPEGDIVASENADGIRMLAFQKLGTIRPSSQIKKQFNISATTDDIPSSFSSFSKTRDDDILQDNQPASYPYIGTGFEHMWQQQPLICQLKNEEDVEKDEDETVLGRTWVDTLSEDDILKLKPLLFVELSAIFDKANIPFPKFKPYKRRKKQDGGIFGASLSALIERDITLTSEHPHHVPFIFTKVLNEIEKRGIREEGVLRVAGHKIKVDRLCQEIEKDFYNDPQKIDQMLERSSIHDLTAVFKKLLRDLPEPLLTSELINLFYQSHRLTECEKALILLVLLLPSENRLTLLAIISFMCKLVEHEADNKMSLHNVAMIIAPSIFPPRYIQVDKNVCNLKAQVELAAVSCRITETLMKFIDRLNIVPSLLINQLRRMNDLEKYRLKENNPMKKFLGNKKLARGDLIMRKIDNEVDYQNGVIRVSASQFNLSCFPVTLDNNTTAGDIVIRIAEIGSKYSVRDGNVKQQQLRRKDIKQRVLTELAPNGNLSCLLATADPDTALNTHFLYEFSGNIGQRRIEPSALVMAIYQQNPNAQWVIHCDHRHAIKQR